MIDLKIAEARNVSHETLGQKYKDWIEYGRIRKCAKEVDCYSMLVERNNHLFIYLSTGQEIKADKFKGVRDDAIKSWLTVLFTIGMEAKKHG
ncbi:MAG: hypothetical protein J6Y29_04110 [Clostridiales bacterium]|nr:hypothetical protein [Clostridiales bacterium]